MFNPNIPSLFFTNPKGKGSHVYGVHANGIIIAETDSNKLKVRPGQNLYFIREQDTDAFRLASEPNVSFVNGIFFIYQPDNNEIFLSLKPDSVFKVPVRISLKRDGTYAGDERCGHPVEYGFNGTCPELNKAFTLVQVLLAISMHWFDLSSGDFTMDNNTPLQISYLV